MKTFMIILLFILFFYNYKHASLTIIYAFDVWYKKLFPSIFPALMLSDLIMNSKIPNIIIKTFGPIFNKIYKINNPGIIILLISIIAGTPTNMSIIKYYYDLKLLSLKDINKLIPLCLFFNPFFVINTASFKCYIITLISSLLVGIIFRYKDYNYIKYNYKNHDKFNLNYSVEKNIKILSNILGIVIIFMVLSSLICTKKPLVDSIISSTLEITTGLLKINSYFNNAEYLYLFVLSFGGLSIYFQINSILKDIKLDYKYIFLYRLLVFILSNICCLTQSLITFTIT